MTPQQRMDQFVQDVYLTQHGNFLDSLTDTDGLVEVNKTYRWCNMFLDELEREADVDGRPMQWNFARRNDVDLGTILTYTTPIITLPAASRKLVIDENRPVTITQAGVIVSHFDVVDAGQITKRTDMSTTDKVTVPKTTLIFSRNFKDYELGGHVIGDVIDKFPRLDTADAATSATLLDIVPYQLLVLGVAKNATLPDIVQGGLSPSFVQKYNDLLDQVKLENADSSMANEAVTDDLGYIGGIF